MIETSTLNFFDEILYTTYAAAISKRIAGSLISAHNAPPLSGRTLFIAPIIYRTYI